MYADLELKPWYYGIVKSKYIIIQVLMDAGSLNFS